MSGKKYLKSANTEDEQKPFFLFRLVWCTLALVSAAARNVSCLDGIVKRTDTLQEVIKVCELGNHQFEKVNQ
jgi:hypothetical protein